MSLAQKPQVEISELRLPSQAKRARVEARILRIDQRLDGVDRVDHAEHRAVLGRHRREIVGRLERARARHVLQDDVRIAGDVLADVAGQHAADRARRSSPARSRPPPAPSCPCRIWRRRPARSTALPRAARRSPACRKDRKRGSMDGIVASRLCARQGAYGYDAQSGAAAQDGCAAIAGDAALRWPRRLADAAGAVCAKMPTSRRPDHVASQLLAGDRLRARRSATTPLARTICERGGRAVPHRLGRGRRARRPLPASVRAAVARARRRRQIQCGYHGLCFDARGPVRARAGAGHGAAAGAGAQLSAGRAPHVRLDLARRRGARRSGDDPGRALGATIRPGRRSPAITTSAPTTSSSTTTCSISRTRASCTRTRSATSRWRRRPVTVDARRQHACACTATCSTSRRRRSTSAPPASPAASTAGTPTTSRRRA